MESALFRSLTAVNPSPSCLADVADAACVRSGPNKDTMRREGRSESNASGERTLAASAKGYSLSICWRFVSPDPLPMAIEEVGG